MGLRFGTHLAFLATRTALFGDATPATGRSLYVALGLQNIGASDLDAVHVSDIGTFVGHEYNGTGYARTALPVLAVSEDHVLHRWSLTANSVGFGVLGAADDGSGAGNTAARSVLVLLSASANPSDDGTAYLVAVIDGNDVTGPKNGDGRRRFIVRWKNGGIVLYGPNCDSPPSTPALALSSAFAMTALHS